jgi:hypothetical protein
MAEYSQDWITRDIRIAEAMGWTELYRYHGLVEGPAGRPPFGPVVGPSGIRALPKFHTDHTAKAELLAWVKKESETDREVLRSFFYVIYQGVEIHGNCREYGECSESDYLEFMTASPELIAQAADAILTDRFFAKQKEKKQQ